MEYQVFIHDNVKKSQPSSSQVTNYFCLDLKS